MRGKARERLCISFAKDKELKLVKVFFTRVFEKIKKYRVVLLVSAILITITAVAFAWGFLAVGYRVFVGDKYVGCVKNPQKMVELRGECEKNTGLSCEDYSIYPALVLGNMVTDEKELLKNYILSRDDIREGIMVKINGVNLFAAESEQKIMAILENYKAPYKNNETTRADIDAKIKLKKGFYHINSFLPPEKIKEELSKMEINVLSVQANGKVLVNGEDPDKWCVPVFAEISSYFGERWGRMHNGIDIAANEGDEVLSAKEGEVTFASFCQGYGNLVILNHGGGIETYYAHLSKISVNVGDKVLKGQKIGNVGNTGNSTGPHLHFEVRINDVAQNPLDFIGF